MTPDYYLHVFTKYTEVGVSTNAFVDKHILVIIQRLTLRDSS